MSTTKMISAEVIISRTRVAPRAEGRASRVCGPWGMGYGVWGDRRSTTAVIAQRPRASTTHPLPHRREDPGRSTWQESPLADRKAPATSTPPSDTHPFRSTHRGPPIRGAARRDASPVPPLHSRDMSAQPRRELFGLRARPDVATTPCCGQLTSSPVARCAPRGMRDTFVMAACVHSWQRPVPSHGVPSQDILRVVARVAWGTSWGLGANWSASAPQTGDAL